MTEHTGGECCEGGREGRELVVVESCYSFLVSKAMQNEAEI